VYVDTGEADVGSSDLRVVSSLLTMEEVSEDIPAVAVEVLDSSGEGIEVDTSVMLEYSDESVTSICDVVSSVGLVSVILDDVSGISVSVRGVSVCILVVSIASLRVDRSSEEGTDPVKVEMGYDVEGTSVDIV
jgi:hypothetical protein